MKKLEIKYKCPKCKYWMTPAEVSFKHCPMCNKDVEPKPSGFYKVDYR